LQSIADVLLQPAIFFPALVFLIGGSTMEMASFLVAGVIAWAAAPVLITVIQSFSSSLRPVTWVAVLARLLGIGAVGWAGTNLDDWSAERLVPFLFSAWCVYQMASALATQSAAPASVNLLASRGRLQHLRWRHVTATLVALATAGLVYRLFAGDTSLATDLQGVLVLATLATVGASWFMVLMLFGRTSVSPALDRGRIGRGMRDALGNSAVRRLLFYRLLLAAVAAFDPFLIVFGFAHIGLDVHLIGMALLAWVVGQVLGSWLWPWVVGKTGERLVFQLASFCRLLLLVWVVSMPSLIETDAFTSRFDGARDGVVPSPSVLCSWVWRGAAGAAANSPYLMRVTSTAGLHGSTLVMNLGAIIGGLLPLPAAWALNRYDDERVFWVAIGVGVMALLASGLLVDTGARVRGRSRAWRQQSRPRAA
jgi:hypothetical protein